VSEGGWLAGKKSTIVIPSRLRIVTRFAKNK
jgi:hypothetical protein